jgi:hypothetical protein
MVVTPSAIRASSRGLPRSLHGGNDAAAGARDFFVTRARQTLLELVGAIAAVNQMGMTIDQAGRDPAAAAIGPSPCIEGGWRVRGRTRIDDAAVVGGDQAIIDQAEALARRRKRRKTAAVPDVIDEGHAGCGPFPVLALGKSVYLSIHIMARRSCPEFRAMVGRRL